jgi:hypothetical protein
MYVTGLSEGTTYSNCYIVLSDGGNTSPSSNTFENFTTSGSPPTPVTGAYQSPSPSSNPITIIYDDMGSRSFNVNGGTLYISGNEYNGTNASNTQIEFSPSFSGSYYECYIILNNTNGQSSQSSNTFTVYIE